MLISTQYRLTETESIVKGICFESECLLFQMIQSVRRQKCEPPVLSTVHVETGPGSDCGETGPTVGLLTSRRTAVKTLQKTIIMNRVPVICKQGGMCSFYKYSPNESTSHSNCFESRKEMNNSP